MTIENKRAYFLVNGSRNGQNIQSYKKMIILYKIGKDFLVSLFYFQFYAKGMTN